MSNSREDIDLFWQASQPASLAHMKTLEVDPFCGEIEVIHWSWSMQAYQIIIIPKEVIFPINKVHTKELK